MQPRYERMLGFWTLTLSRPQSAAVTPCRQLDLVPADPSTVASLACRIVSVTGLLLSSLPPEVYLS